MKSVIIIAFLFAILINEVAYAQSRPWPFYSTRRVRVNAYLLAEQRLQRQFGYHRILIHRGCNVNAVNRWGWVTKWGNFAMFDSTGKKLSKYSYEQILISRMDSVAFCARRLKNQEIIVEIIDPALNIKPIEITNTISESWIQLASSQH